MPKPANSKPVKLTDAKASSAGIGAHQDSEVKALRLVVSAKGSRSWLFYMWSKAEQRPIKKTIGDQTLMSVQDARTKARRWAVLLGDGKTISGAQVGKDAPKTLGELAQRYTNRVVTHRKLRGPDWAQISVEKHAADWLRLPLVGVTRDMVAERHNRVRDGKVAKGLKHQRGGGVTAAARLVKSVRTLYKHAADEGWFVGENPAAKVRTARYEARARVFEGTEEQRFLDVLENWRESGLAPWARNFFRLLLATGVRRATLEGASWNEFDLTEGQEVWTIPAERAKTDVRQRLELGTEEVALLKQQKEVVGASKWVFPSPVDGSTGHITSATYQWRKLCKAAGIAGMVPHDLRRSMITALVDAGADIETAAASAGHKDSRTTANTYRVVRGGRVRGAKERVARTVAPSKRVA